MSTDFTRPNLTIGGRFAALERGLSVPNPEWLIPDEVVEQCARRWDLLEPGKIGIDPFAGTASILFAQKLEELGFTYYKGKVTITDLFVGFPRQH